jgi:hypothetical protein
MKARILFPWPTKFWLGLYTDLKLKLQLANLAGQRKSVWRSVPPYVGVIVIKFKPKLDLAVIGLDMTTSSSSGWNLNFFPKRAGTNLRESSIF